MLKRQRRGGSSKPAWRAAAHMPRAYQRYAIAQKATCGEKIVLAAALHDNIHLSHYNRLGAVEKRRMVVVKSIKRNLRSPNARSAAPRSDFSHRASASARRELRAVGGEAMALAQ